MRSFALSAHTADARTNLIEFWQFLRPRWTGLYAARKRQKHAASSLPELPDTFFGWIPALYQITEEQVLASAGLDAYVVRLYGVSRLVHG